jgi:hypothetical protein
MPSPTRPKLEPTPQTKRTLTVVAAVCALALAGLLALGGAVAHAQTSTDGTGSVVNATLRSLAAAITALQARVATLEGAEHVDRATVSAAGAVVTQNGAWLDRVDHLSPGAYTLAFAPGTFKAPPTCVATASATDIALPGTVVSPTLVAASVACAPATLTSLTCQARAERVGGVNAGMSVICAGP